MTALCSLQYSGDVQRTRAFNRAFLYSNTNEMTIGYYTTTVSKFMKEQRERAEGLERDGGLWTEKQRGRLIVGRVKEVSSNGQLGEKLAINRGTKIKIKTWA